MKRINRREFIKMGLSSLSVMAVGSHLNIPGMFGKNQALAQVPAVNLTITDALVEMIDLIPVYHWVFADQGGPRFPGPLIVANEGASVTFNITNALDEPHAVAISGTKINSGLINPGQQASMVFTAPAAGTYIYYDPLNAPVNRVLGLHGVLIVLPVGVTNNPYSNPTLNVQQLFNDFGTTAHFPGNPWNPARTFVWVVHQIDPLLNAQAQPAGAPPINRVNFVNQFLPRYFTITGKSGHFVVEDEEITPNGRVGQPALVRIVNTGLVTESLHIHANHVYPVSINGVIQSNVHYIDTMTSGPMDRIDWLVPFIRPPDIPVKPGNPGANAPFQSQPTIRFDASEELAFITPDNLIQLSPMDYPMHDHMEPSQTAAGGNYNAGLLSHIIFTGDIDGVDFPTQPG
jgi:FtsP/CotA-like multicopper oxidase with cupredoxin domain